MTEPNAPKRRSRIQLLVRVLLIALGFNIVAWVGAASGPAAQSSWKVVSLIGCFVLGLAVGRWWALLVTFAFGLIHAVPVLLGLLPGYLSTWGEALWWAFALVLLLGLTGLGVLSRKAIHRIQRGRVVRR